MSKMISFELLSAVVVLSNEGSYARAAYELQSTPILLEEQISALERHLGVRIFDRSNKQVTVTPDGQIFVEACRASLDEAQRIGNRKDSE